MRTRAVLGGIFGSVAVLAIGWQAGAAAAHNASAEASPAAPVQTDNSSSGSDQSITPPTATTPSPSPTSTGSSPTSSGKSGTFTGDTVNTQFGPVQVKITVKAGKLTDVTPLQLTTDGGRSVQISNYAAPILRSEVLAAQSANVSSVGGATYTSQGYLSSLQSALDKAGL
ncbi:MAG: hypothetical protein QOK08_232 [Actinomycetota bacterium]|nr:FMN-binding protein [Glaciihabitans sp.]MDQ1542594.1 hypothetical protein [Actinomycetota bacterium]MDQ1561397.1 hypothetical protein [Actinomycetota bacterium]